MYFGFKIKIVKVLQILKRVQDETKKICLTSLF